MGKAQWGRFARVSIAGRVGGEGGISGVCLQEKVVRSPIQLVEGLHGLPYHLINQIDPWRS